MSASVWRGRVAETSSPAAYPQCGHESKPKWRAATRSGISHRVESRAARILRLVALVVFGATAFLPVHGCGPTPSDFEVATPRALQDDQHPVGGESRPRGPTVLDPIQTPVNEIREALERGWQEGSLGQALRGLRRWYPYVLLPFWLGLLAYGATGGLSRRKFAGQAALALSLAIAVYEAFYLADEFGERLLLPAAWHWVEVVAVWLIVCAALFWRRRGRSRAELEACLSAQALLSALHGLSFVAGDAREWLQDGHALVPVARALLATYLLAFWVAVAALLAAAVPGYLRPALVGKGGAAIPTLPPRPAL